MNESPWVVLKFGGTSVSTLENWNIIRKVVVDRLNQGKKVLIVHSALSNVSNLLEQALTASISHEHQPIIDTIIEKHVVLAQAMGLDGRALLGHYFEQLNHVLQGIALVGEYSPRVQAKIVSLGEMMSTTLGSHYLASCQLQAQWLDAKTLLRSIDSIDASSTQRYLNASCDFQPDDALLATSRHWPNAVITQGFIASNDEDEVVLLGRGGSDTSGAYLAAKLSAECYEIWTDVPGMFTANPREIPSARLIKHLAYDEAQEIATTGAKILHPRCILPVRRQQVPTKVFCTNRPELDGTTISEKTSRQALVKAISSRKNVTLISMETVGMWHQVGFLAEAFGHFKDLGLSVDLISTSESNVTVSLDPGGTSLDTELTRRLTRRLEPICHLTILRNCAAVSVVGRNIRTILHKIGPAFEVFHEHKVHLLSQAANDLNLTIVVDESQADRLVQQLHGMFISSVQDNDTFGQTWEKLFAAEVDSTSLAQAWWKKRSKQLLQLGEGSSPMYVYNLSTITHSVGQLQSLTSIDKIYYAIKANSNPDVLKHIDTLGIGFECVSEGELDLVLSLFPDIDPERILFTPNFAPKEEYEKALALGCHVTLDNSYPARHWPEVFAGKNLLLRLDPGSGGGHHDHVKTTGNQAKFGIPLEEMDEVVALLASHQTRVIGLHAHTGSGILDHENWKKTAIKLLRIAQTLPDVKFIDLGGGFGVPEKADQTDLDMRALDDALAEVKSAFPQYQLWLEPGRYIVSQAGVLLAQVTQTKGKGRYSYVGINTGMNSLIRPALYGAYHEIVNLSRIDASATHIYDVVGPICETGDKLGVERHLPETEEKDVILIANSGAYGFVMSSSYNQRAPAEEVIVNWE